MWIMLLHLHVNLNADDAIFQFFIFYTFIFLSNTKYMYVNCFSHKIIVLGCIFLDSHI